VILFQQLCDHNIKIWQYTFVYFLKELTWIWILKPTKVSTRRLKTITSQEENKTFTGDYRCQENQIKMLKLSTDAYTILAEDQIIYHVIGKFVANKQHPNYLVIPIEIGIGKIIDIMEIGGAARFFHGTITRED
jgi:hypothetical protein